jgi:hypothetical protein
METVETPLDLPLEESYPVADAGFEEGGFIRKFRKPHPLLLSHTHSEASEA